MSSLFSKRINTESSKENSSCKLTSTASSNRFSPTFKQQEEEGKHNSSDLKAFQNKHKARLDKGFNCLELIKVSYPISFVTSADLLKLEFSPLSYPIKDLIIYAKSIVQSSYERKIIGRSFNLLKLIQLIAGKYHVSAYHNFTHAFSVLQLLFQSYSKSGRLQRILTQKQWFYVFIAALMHDISHPGTNNAFEVKQGSKLAVEAGDQSVLEKMHLSVFWKLLKSNSQVNFLQGCPMMESIEIKKLITRMVMSTDAIRHPEGVDTIKKLHLYRKTLKGENAMLFVEQIFHACDVGNPCLPFQSYMNWSALITYEFDQIAAREEELGEKVTSYLKYEGLDKFYKGQVGFCEYLVLPLWRQISQILPELEEMVQNIKNNITELNVRISKPIS